jgi:MFS family permease
MHAQVLLLATAQALVQTASALVMTIGALAGAQVARTEFATAPIAAMFLGTVIAMVPASLWMARSGRRPGFIAGALLGVVGGTTAAAGLFLDSLLVVLIGTLLIGAYQGFAQFYRFAAAEIADDAFRPRAISLVLAGGVVAAVFGPWLARLGAPLLEAAYAGSFLILSALSLVAAILLVGFRVPPLLRRGITAGQPRPLVAIMRQPTYAVALFGAATGSGVMVVAMTATPLAMTQHHHDLADTATVIQMHVLGMFAPSFFTGLLIDRFGVLRVMLAGASLLAGHVTLTFSGVGFASFASALILLGIGWNFLYIGGTTLLTRTYLPAESGRAQAANDLLIYLVGLAAALSAGALLNALGWRWMNAALLPWLIIAGLAISWLGWRQGSLGSRRGESSIGTST